MMYRLHAGINFLRPADMFFGRGQQVLTERKLKLKLLEQTENKKILKVDWKICTEILLKTKSNSPN